ncbi:MAG: hypothetical protein RL154_700 [Pseudomonadota bacterium]|jgi:hypothetical protein
MRDEYDFSKGERGKFFRPKEDLEIPVYLDKDVREFILERISKSHMDVHTLVNQVLRRDIEIAKSLAG